MLLLLLACFQGSNVANTGYTTTSYSSSWSSPYGSGTTSTPTSTTVDTDTTTPSEPCTDYRLNLNGATTGAPAVVKLDLTITDCDGTSVEFATEDFEIFEDGSPISSFESDLSVVTNEQEFALGTLLLLDMSGSIIDSGQLPNLLDAATDFVQALDERHAVAIYTFDGRPDPSPVVSFTSDRPTLRAAIDGLAEYQVVDSSTNLNGAVLGGLEALDVWEASATEFVVAGSLAVFTDGQDQAGYHTDEEAVAAARGTSHAVYAIGLGQDVDADHLDQVGKDASVIASDVSGLGSAFTEVADQIADQAKSQYVVAYCSPSRANEHTLTLRIKGSDQQAEYCFDADGFAGGCAPENFTDASGIEPIEDCALDSGWPCPCTDAVCDDGSLCIWIDGLDTSVGYCSPTCEVDADCGCHNSSADANCNITHTNEYTSGGEQEYLCSLGCDDDRQCPQGMTCQVANASTGLCYPSPY